MFPDYCTHFHPLVLLTSEPALPLSTFGGMVAFRNNGHDRCPSEPADLPVAIVVAQAAGPRATMGCIPFKGPSTLAHIASSACSHVSCVYAPVVVG